MCAAESGGEPPLEESTLLLSGRFGVASMSGGPHTSPERDAALPAVHIRVRPTLPHLGETNEQRRVWCVDHQNIFVQSSKTLPDRLPNTSPRRLPTNNTNNTNNINTTTTTRARKTTTSRCLSFSPRKREVQQGTQMLSKDAQPKRTRSASQRHCATTSLSSTTQTTQKPGVPTTPEVLLSGRSGINGKEEHFVFDFVHNEDATQEEVFEESVLDFIEKALVAQNVAIVCYGPTGSGKTYSMMGSTPVHSHRKQKGVISVRENTLSSERSQRFFNSKGRGQANLFLEVTPSSCKSSNTTEVTTLTDLTAAMTALAGTPAENEQEDHSGKCRTSVLGNDATDLTCSWSSGLSRCDADSSSLLEFSGVCRHEMGLAGACSDAAGRAVTQREEETIGLLPRIVLILLERRGVPIVLNREETSTKGASANRGGSEKEKNTEKQTKRQSLSLTLQELVLYGVELYMDEFRDLLDPAKRPISNVGDIGGLDAFCQKMNNFTVSTTRSDGNGGGTAKKANGNGGKSVPLRGGGVPVSTIDDFRRCYKLASRNRVTKGHQRNDISSRSHAMFFLQLQFALTDSQGAGGGAAMQTLHSYVAMVDLAGSERVKETKVEGQALREAQYINKSLSALSAVLLALYQRSSHVPYRDSKLTRLLRPCFESGNVLTLVHVPPCSAEETISGLKFAEQVRYTNVQTHNGLNASNELVALFQDMRDRDATECAEAYHQLHMEHAQLCAEVRLAHFTREAQEAAQHDSLTSSVNSSNRLSFRQDLLHNQKREYVIRSLANRMMLRYAMQEDEKLREAIAEIERSQNLYVEEAERRMKQDIETTRAAIEKLEACNAQLAEENSRPVLRDAHAMTMRQRLKELTADVTNCARERLLLSEGIRAIRQRLAMRGDLECCLDDQLSEIRAKVGVDDGNFAGMPVDANEDAEMRSVYYEQLLLSREMSLLRDESTCFIKGDEMWEGLWARVMRQELLLILNIEMEMMEGIMLRPQSLCWALKKNGLTPEAAKDVVCSSSSAAVHVKKLLDAFETMRRHPTGSLRRNSVSHARSFHPSPIPLALSNGDEVRCAATLIGCYGDEAKLQEASVQKLFQEGICCEVTCLSMNVNEFMTQQSSLEEVMGQSGYKLQWGSLRLVHPPKDASSYCLEFYQRTYASSDKVRDRRTISIPLSEPQLCIKLHVIEAEGIVRSSAWDDESTTAGAPLPLIALELRGVFPPTLSATGDARVQSKEGGEAAKMREGTRCSAGRHSDINGTYNCNGFMSGTAENAAASDIVLAKRLDCGGELQLPSGCMTSFEKGSGCILLQFPERLVAASTRTEAVECIVAALSGLTVPLFPSTSKPSFTGEEELGAISSNLCVATYRHVPYVLLGSQGGPLCDGATANSLFSCGVGMPLLGYTSAMLVRFYFNKETDDTSASVKGDASSQSTHSSNRRPVTPLLTACTMLNRLGVITVSRGGGGGHGDVCGGSEKTAEGVEETESLLSRMYRLHTFRKRARAGVRQQIFDAEDTKAELLYSFSEGELLRGSYIKDVSKEARELIDLQQPQAGALFSIRGLVRANPALCRELCGAAIPWTVWQWAHRWKALQEAYRQRQGRVCVRPVNDDGDEDDGDDGDDDNSEDGRGGEPPARTTFSTAKEDGRKAFVVFEEVPYFLEGME